MYVLLIFAVEAARHDRNIFRRRLQSGGETLQSAQKHPDARWLQIEHTCKLRFTARRDDTGIKGENESGHV